MMTVYEQINTNYEQKVRKPNKNITSVMRSGQREFIKLCMMCVHNT